VAAISGYRYLHRSMGDQVVMTTAEESSNTVATALRGAVDKAVDLMDSSHLRSLGDAGHEVVSRVLAGPPDLAAHLASAPVDLPSLRVSTARRAHQLADSIDERADALAPTNRGGHRWLKRLLVLALAGAAALYLGRKLTQKKTPLQRVDELPDDVIHEEAIAHGSSGGATAGEPADALATPPGPKSSSNGARSTKAGSK
jgi:hypothetical protein